MKSATLEELVLGQDVAQEIVNDRFRLLEMSSNQPQDHLVLFLGRKLPGLSLKVFRRNCRAFRIENNQIHQALDCMHLAEEHVLLLERCTS